MGMDWLKGLVGSSDGMVPAGGQLPASPWAQQQQPPQAYGAPPQGYGAPPQGYAAPQQQGYGAPPQAYPGPAPQAYPGPAPQGFPAQPGYGGPPGPQAGAAPQGYPAAQPGAAPGGAPPGGVTTPWGGQPAGAPAGAPADVAALEARCAQLRNDVDSIALFARTLLTLLSEKQICTEQQFLETKRRLDLLDGKLDDK